MEQPRGLRRWLACALAVSSLAAAVAEAQYLRSPEPGSIYKEFVFLTNWNTWRVTDPNAPYQGPPGSTPADSLPNPVLTLSGVDLQGAVRAEALIDYWGGHTGTIGQKLRFNGNAWIPFPELATTPAGKAECYNQQWNVVVDVPLSHLVGGANTFEGTSGGQTCYDFGWGQWGWYAITLRVYYGPSKPHPTGSIVAPLAGATIGENPRLAAQAQSAAGIDRIEYVAYYDGYDPDGDGRYKDWQHAHFRSYWGASKISNHAGTASAAPWETTWNTELVPDQPAGGVKLVARIRDKAGVWYVTDAVTGLTLDRPGVSVRLYKPSNVPEAFWVRDHWLRQSTVTIPASDPLSRAISAKLLVRTWNGIDGMAEPGEHHYTRVNGYQTPTYGQNHWYSYDVLDVPVSSLVAGTNTIKFFSESIHHGIEILWPGPAILVRYSGSLPRCGDRIVDPGEQCDDGNGTNGDGCSTECRQEVCGDGTVQATLGEQCDDGNLANGDGCSAACQIEVLPPRIVEHPVNVTVAENGSATFRIVAAGTAPLAFAWQRLNGTTWVNVTGATQDQLVLASVTGADDGAQFRCRVSNSVTAVTSNAAVLDVVPAARVTSGLLALYRFDEGTGAVVHDVSGTGVPLDLTIAVPANSRWETGGGLTLIAPTQVVSPGPAAKITSAVSMSGALTLEAWIRPANLTQNGPARIATISADPLARNLTLGQGVSGGSSALYDVRLRSSGTSTNGTPSLSTAAGTLTTTRTHVVFTRTAAGATRIWIDGVERASGTASGNLAGWDPAQRLALGDEFSGGRPWLGTYDLVAFYDRALPQSEVLQNYLIGPVRCGAGGAACDDDCPTDPYKTDPGECGCGVADTDTDADSVADCRDAWPEDGARSGPIVFDRVSVGGDWLTVELPATYKNPVVIAGVPSLRAGGPGVAQVRSVGPQSFEIRFKEWRYLDGVHTAERIPYIVIEAGRHALNDGSTWEAGRFSQDGAQAFKPRSFASSFAAPPALLLSVQTVNGGDPVSVRARSVTAAGFDAGMFEEEKLADGKHVAEQLGYVAIHAPAGGGLVYTAGQFRAYSLAQVQLDSAFRPVGEWLVKLEEEKSKNPETSHSLEGVSTLAIEGKLYGQLVTFTGPDPCALRYKMP